MVTGPVVMYYSHDVTPPPPRIWAGFSGGGSRLGSSSFVLLPNLFFSFVSTNPHPSPTPSCAQLQPPNGPKLAQICPVYVPEGSRISNHFSQSLGPQLAILGARPLAAKTSQNGPK